MIKNAAYILSRMAGCPIPGEARHPKGQYVEMYLSPDESHLSFGDRGKLDLMIPIKAKHVNNGEITIACEILERKTVRDKIRFDFDVLAPINGNRNSWATFMKVDKSFFHVQEVVNVDILLENNGIPSTFFFSWRYWIVLPLLELDNRRQKLV